MRYLCIIAILRYYLNKFCFRFDTSFSQELFTLQSAAVQHRCHVYSSLNSETIRAKSIDVLRGANCETASISSISDSSFTQLRSLCEQAPRKSSKTREVNREKNGNKSREEAVRTLDICTFDVSMVFAMLSRKPGLPPILNVKRYAPRIALRGNKERCWRVRGEKPFAVTFFSRVSSRGDAALITSLPCDVMPDQYCFVCASNEGIFLDVTPDNLSSFGDQIETCMSAKV